MEELKRDRSVKVWDLKKQGKSDKSARKTWDPQRKNKKAVKLLQKRKGKRKRKAK